MEYSTLELLDKQIAVNRSAAIVVTITGAVTTAAALGLALLLIKSKNAISLIMAFFTIAMLPQMRFLAHNLLNMQECRKRKKALQNGTFEEKYHQTEEEFKQFMYTGLQDIIEREQSQRNI